MDTETTRHALDLMDEVVESIIVQPNIRINQNSILKKIHQHSKKNITKSSVPVTTTSSATTLSKSSVTTSSKTSATTLSSKTSSSEITDEETSEPLIERSSELKVTALSIGSILDTKTHNSTETHLSETDRAHNLALTKTTHNKKGNNTRTPTFII